MNTHRVQYSGECLICNQKVSASRGINQDEVSETEMVNTVKIVKRAFKLEMKCHMWDHYVEDGNASKDLIEDADAENMHTQIG